MTVTNKPVVESHQSLILSLMRLFEVHLAKKPAHEAVSLAAYTSGTAVGLLAGRFSQAFEGHHAVSAIGTIRDVFCEAYDTASGVAQVRDEREGRDQ